jgi:uncharacterized protein
MTETVAIIGASDKPQRYAYKAMQALQANGHDVKLVNPYKKEIEGQRCYYSVTDIAETIDTATLYVNPARFRDYIDDVIKIKPGRVIMNPGTEDDEMEIALEQNGISVLRACTLVMLSTGTF